MQRAKVLGRRQLGLLLAVGFAASANGQTVAPPTAFMWAPSRPTGWAGYGNLTPKVHLDTNYNVPGTSDAAATHPYEAGAWCATEAATLAGTSGAPSPFKVDILIKEFGKNGDPSGSPGADDRYFFRPQDYLPAPSGGFSWPDSGDSVTKHPYLHPFLVNAGARSDVASPLREWMVDFIAGYKSVAGSTAPAAIRFDNEVTIAAPVGPNPLYILRLLRGTSYWNDRDVPGQSMTLEDLYAAAATANGWESDILDQIDTTYNAIDYQGSEIDGDTRNREVAQWWYSICQQARDAVMKYSAYDVIHDSTDGWDGATGGVFNVKCGNYDDINADGELDKTGWFTDRAFTDDQVTDNHWPVPGWRSWNWLPRADVERSHGGALYFMNNDRRYWGLIKKASGESDCPVLYELQQTELDGDGYRPGLQQMNEYMQVAEGYWDTVLRVSRHSVESTINSNGGLHESRLAPWVEMPGTSFDDHDRPISFAGTRYQHEIAALLAMLRAKATPAVQFFFDKNVGEPANPTDLAAAWLQTSQVLHQVWATRVALYKTKAFGAETAYDTDKLEFTLRKGSPQADYEAAFTYSLAPYFSGGIQYGDWGAYIQTDFNWVNNSGTDTDWRNLLDSGSGSYSPDYTGPINYVHVNAEYATNRAGTKVKLSIWHDGSPGSWEDVDIFTSGTDNVPADENGWYRYRIGHDFEYNSNLIRSVAGGHFQSRVKLTLLNHGGTFNCTTDLMQVYPAYVVYTAIGGDSMMYSAADMNQDGIVDEFDLVEFLDAWANEAPSADMDQSDTLDFEDIAAFESAL